MAYNVIIRHFCPSTTVKNIQASLTDIGRKVIRVTNIIHFAYQKIHIVFIWNLQKNY